MWPGMRGRDAVRKSSLKVNILHVFTIDFSEIQFIVNHNSQYDGPDKSAKSAMNLHMKTIHIVSLWRKRKDTKDNGILLWTKQAKNGRKKLRSDFRAAVLMKNRLHHESGEQVEERLHQGHKSEWNWRSELNFF